MIIIHSFKDPGLYIDHLNTIDALFDKETMLLRYFTDIFYKSVRVVDASKYI